LIVGERDVQLPVWPLFRQDGTAVPLVGRVYESVDLAPIPGFSGTPAKLLVALDARGAFMDVQVLSQHEPAHGVRHALVDAREYAMAGHDPAGARWTLDIADPIAEGRLVARPSADGRWGATPGPALATA